MKAPIKHILLLFFLFLMCSISSQEFEYRKVENNTFDVGEKLKFKVYYHSFITGKVNAGNATLEVKKSNRRFNKREIYRIVGIGKSNTAFDLFFKVRDRFESYVDKEALIPHLFIRRTKEGISAAYYLRTFDFNNARKGQNYSVDFYLDDSAYISVIQFVGREVVETELGVFKCLAFKPMLATGEVFSNQYPMTLWVTDDKNKLPVLAKSEVIVGSVKMELIKFSGLKHPIDALIED